MRLDRRALTTTVSILLAASMARADSPLPLTVSILGTEGGVLHLPADTSMPFYVDGFIGDPAGAELPGISVTDGTQSTKTLQGGLWSLPEPAIGEYIVAMSSDRTNTAVFRLDAPGIPGVYGAAVTLPYNIGVSSWSIDGAEATVTVVTTAPANGLCVFVIDAVTGASTPAAITGTSDAGGASVWTATISSSIQRVRVVAYQCSTPTRLTDTRSVTYPLERTAGSLSGGTVWFNTTHPVMAFGVSDSGGSGVDPESVAVTVNGRALAVGPYIGPVFEAQARGLSDGLYPARIDLADLAGNATTVPLTIAVDTVSPTLVDLSPAEGDVTGPAPTISVAASDLGGSGINVNASRFVLTNGIIAATLRPTLSSGTLSYEVPSLGFGPNLGDGPLPPGFYTVDAFVQDVAGNETHVSAFFTVVPF